MKSAEEILKSVIEKDNNDDYLSTTYESDGCGSRKTYIREDLVLHAIETALWDQANE